MDIHLVSCRSLPEPDPDEAPLVSALTTSGFEVDTVAWDDPAVDWAAAPLSILRSCWNYPQAPDAFRGWLTEASKHTQLVNPVDVVQWNLHKRYLLTLADKGVPVTPTVVIERGKKVDLRQLMKARGWTDVVVKPAMSANSWRTVQVTLGNIDEGQQHLNALTAERDALVQLFLTSVDSYGERSLVYIDGELTHAVRKEPRFMQDKLPRSPHVKVDATEAEQTLAATTLATIPGRGDGEFPLYARIDMTPGPDGQPMLMELELIEPSLWFDKSPIALTRFVEGVVRRRR